MAAATFILNGEAVNLTPDVDPSLSLAEFLRLRTKFKGTKIGCGEGGCGACAVKVTDYDKDTDTVATRTINSCLCPVGTLHGKAITTVEGVGNTKDGFHPVQEAFAKSFASQCGYCTPGFIVASHAALERAAARGEKPSAEQLQQSLDGNLCRCTGYRPILDACKAAADACDIEELCGSRRCQGCPGKSNAVDVQHQLRSMEDLPAYLPVHCHGSKRWYAPKSLTQLLQLLARHSGEGPHLLAGNTGAGVYKYWPTAQVVLDVKDVAEFKAVEWGKGSLQLGAAVTIAQLIELLHQPQVPNKHAAEVIVKHLHRIAGTHVRYAATVGGHMALAKSRALESDLCTLLLALDAKVQIVNVDQTSDWVDLDEFLCPTHLPLSPTQVVAAVCFTLPGEGDHYWSHKTALRYYNSHALVNLAVWKQSNGEARVGLGCPVLTDTGSLSWQASRVKSVERVISGSASLSPEMLVDALKAMNKQLGAKPVTGKRARKEDILAELAALQPFHGDVQAAMYPPAGLFEMPCGEFRKREHVDKYQEAFADAVRRRKARLANQSKQATEHKPEGAAHGAPDTSSPAQTLSPPWPLVPKNTPEVHEPTGNKDLEYAHAAAEAVLFMALVPLVDQSALETNPAFAALVRGAAPLPVPPPVQATHNLPVYNDENAPLHQPVMKDNVLLQASGEAQYTSDIMGSYGQLYAAYVTSTEPLAAVDAIDPSAALAAGAVAFIGASDVPNANQGYDCPLFADKVTTYVGEPLGVVLANTPREAEAFAKLVEVTYSHPPELGKPIITLQQAVEEGSFFDIGLEENRVGDVASALSDAPFRITNARYTMPSQHHLYMETQNATAVPSEDGTMTVYSSTQSLDAVQLAVSRALGVPFNQVNAVCTRVGGAFGGKSTRQMPIAAIAAVAAAKTGRKVQFMLNRNEDFRQNPGRCPGYMDYSVGFDDQGVITALDMQVVLQSGQYMDTSNSDVVLLAIGADIAYNFPNMRVKVQLAKCNMQPRTIMRAPGFVQAALFTDQVMEHVAAFLGLDPVEVKARNFLPDPAASVGPADVTAQLHHRLRNLHLPPGQDLDGSQQARAPIKGACAHGDCASGARGAETGSKTCCHTGPCKSSSSIASAETQNAFDFIKNGTVASNKAIARATGVAPAGQKPFKSPCHSALTNAVSVTEKPTLKLPLGRPLQADLYTMPRIWAQLQSQGQYKERKAAIEDFNKSNIWRKKAIAMTPCRFDAATFAQIAAVSVFYDGSVLVTTSGSEMGQGMNTKLKQMASWALGQALPAGQSPLPMDLIRIGTGSSFVVPGGGPTWSSTGSESTCQALRIACEQLVQQIKPIMQDQGDAASSWKATLASTMDDPGTTPSTIQLSAIGYWSGNGDDGSPLMYSAFGAALTEVEVDLLTGERSVERVDMLYDCGHSLNPMLDLGQIEGAFVMGMGMMLEEDVISDPATGKLLTDSTWTYKVPTVACIPRNFNISFLEDSPNPLGIMSSKAVGEPGVMLSSSTIIAMQQAISTAQTQLAQLLPTTFSPKLTDSPHGAPFAPLPAPATPPNLRLAVGSFRVADVLASALSATAPLQTTCDGPFVGGTRERANGMRERVGDLSLQVGELLRDQKDAAAEDMEEDVSDGEWVVVDGSE